MTPLHVAANQNRLIFCQTLVEHDDHLLVFKDNAGNMPFHTAIETNDEDTFKYLLIKTEQVRKVMHRTDKMNFIPTKDLIGHR